VSWDPGDRWARCDWWGLPDLTDSQWALVEPLLPAVRVGSKGGRRGKHPRRRIVDAILRAVVRHDRRPWSAGRWSASWSAGSPASVPPPGPARNHWFSWGRSRCCSNVTGGTADPAGGGDRPGRSGSPGGWRRGWVGRFRPSREP